MRRAPLVCTLVLPLFALAACHIGGKPAVAINNSDTNASARWNGTLATPPDLAGALDVKGTAWMAPNASQSTVVHVSISNAAPGGVHPWHVHSGTCGSQGEQLGPTDAYKMLRVGDAGTATADATLPITMPTNGSYYVDVHASATNMSTVVACGNLAPPLKQQ
jgi:hypothetical protein